MKAAIRLEISKKDEEALLAKVDNYIYYLNAGANPKETSKQELVTFYRTQLHKVFKMGLNANIPNNQIEE